MAKTKNIYFHNLNGLRFIAAFAVVVSHIEYSKKAINLPNMMSKFSFFINGGGTVAVSLFFVLSGFLITYLLIREKEKTTSIHFRKFLIRRALRIWPLYFIFISIIIFFFTNQSSRTGSYLYFLILPNIALASGYPILHISHLWSIGVEEQFYILWPIIMKFAKRNLVIVIMSLIIITVPIIPHLCDFITIRLPDYQAPLKLIKGFSLYFKIDQMALGGIAGFIFHSHHGKIQKIISRNISLFILLIAILFLVFPISGSIVPRYFYGILFSILMLSLTCGPALSILENKVINKLGQISYGIYTIHWVIVHYTISNIIQLEIANSTLNNILIYFISIISTIILSIFSYEIIEKKFLKLKRSFTIISSGAVK